MEKQQSESECNNSSLDEHLRGICVGIVLGAFILCEKFCNPSANNERIVIEQETNAGEDSGIFFNATSIAEPQLNTYLDAESGENSHANSSTVTHFHDRMETEPGENDNETKLKRNGFPKFMVDYERIFAVTILFLDILSAIFDQLSSPRNYNYALAAMMLSFITMIFCIIEIVHKGRKQKVMWRRRRNIRIYWFYNPTDFKPFGNLTDIFAIIHSILEFIMATITCVFHLQQKNNPIKIPHRSIVFDVFLFCSKFHVDQGK